MDKTKMTPAAHKALDDMYTKAIAAQKALRMKARWDLETKLVMLRAENQITELQREHRRSYFDLVG